MPVRSTMDRTTVAPSSSTGTGFKALPKAPTGVRNGETIAALFMVLFLGGGCRLAFEDGRRALLGDQP
jgi:hypothetical protein